MASPEHTASSTEIAAFVGYSSIVVVHGVFARLCKAVYVELRTLHRPQRLQRPGQWWLVLAERGDRDTDGFPWRLRPSVVRALTALSFAPDRLPRRASLPRSVPFLEGAQRMRWVTAYERNPQARARCLRQHGGLCAVCGLDFGKVYGPEAVTCIHVHHLEPLAGRAGRHAVDPVKDLRPVCPNCHAVIHAGGKVRSLREVGAMLRRARSRR